MVDVTSALDAWEYSRTGLLVPPRSRPRYDRPVGIGLFAGAGGMDLGLHMGGFHMAAAVEYDPTAAMTYMVNLARPGVKIHFDGPERERAFTRMLEKSLFPRKPKGNRKSQHERELVPNAHLAGSGWISGQPADVRGCEHFWVADVRSLTGKEILDALGLEQGEVDVVAGGPPCQGFSMANANRSVMDPRNSLVFEFARLIVEIRPKTMIMENVPQVATMLTPEGVPVIDAFARILADGGFSAYNALKASLAANAGAGAVMRRDAVSSDNDGDALDDDEQLDLFGAPS